jgi:4-diphosphocytidyl-2-C-methyl-D-erythritol kinase
MEREAPSIQSMRWWPAPAKLNLFLHVTGRRADGFHDLQTVFQLLDWGDEIGIECTQDARIERIAGPDSIAPEHDLTVRAARALQQASGVQRGARIQLRKRIPIGGGLGGGSSDAATVLKVLNLHWGAHLNPADLAQVGLALGSDVPVFLGGSSAWGSGRGDALAALELPEKWYVIVHPAVAISTASLFQAPELTRNSPLVTMRDFSPGLGRNDFEPVVRKRFPEVAAALDWLGEGARLSGTGSCVFQAFASSAAAERVAARVPDEWRSFVARGVNRSPLEAALAIIA